MLRTIILVIVILLVLSYFGISIQHTVDSATGQANFTYVGELLQKGWDGLVLFFNTLLDSMKNLI